MLCLTVVEGAQVGVRFLLGNRPLSIGRDPTRDIQITDPRASRRHAMVRRTEAGHAIMPVRALNGVSVNGQPVTGERVLLPGDRVTIGGTLLAVESWQREPVADGVHDWKDASTSMRENHTLL